ncbi:MAG: nucleotidyltransferase domain-containing protein [Lachnospiraceae bacterium]|nr:nucleotidyltransferase domain-containing protein [Lachnospiraceae bacterium]
MISDDLKKIILFGSYARGDYTEESDIDIAVLLNCEREESAKYKSGLVALSAEMDLENMTVVNFTCIPYSEFNARKGYYPFYANIEREGKVLYG